MTGRLAAAPRARRDRESDDALAAAARAGDREALDVLVRRHLPMVYNVVRQALGAHPDVDDVVQDIVLRALRQLRRLRRPESFRPWLAAITVRQVGTYLARAGQADGRTAALDEAAWRPDAAAELEGPALLRVEIAGQRRQVRHASRWLSADERAVLALWWLETVGEVSRPDVAGALGLTIAHVGVRLQRMRDQLDLSRAIVAALEAMPGCPGLADVVADWNGVPSPFWRKRIARHTRSCPACTAAADGLIPAERLLLGLALLPVPAAVSAATSTTVAAGRILHVPGPRGWAVTAAATAAVVAGLWVTTSSGSAPPAAPAVAAPPTRAAVVPVRVGRLSLESANARGRFVAADGEQGQLDAAADGKARRRATLQAIPGLTGSGCFTFRTADGRHLRHQDWRLRASLDQATSLARGDATFCVRDGAVAGSVSLESANYPGFFLRHVGSELWVDQYDGTAAFRADSSFLVRSPLI
ncbi:sigma-70 family RNA polymerase sigma factor [Actinoplanes sp. NPDC026619]|uniref:sigma-70 family RNA polymerase sigma factor n=1 Tax=Actinoplanes sp. NPDC026619 TaxID=3155798 RepID=UPI0033CC5E9C